MTNTQMTKKEQNALVKAGNEMEFTFEGEDQSDMEMPYACLHQGKLSKTSLGDHPEGSLISSLTKEQIRGRKFIPLHGWKTYKVMGNNNTVEQVTNNKSELPSDALSWVDDRPPRATVFRRFLVLFEGEDMPCILSFRGYGKSASAGKTLATLQKMRSGQGKGAGMFTYAVTESTNDKGEWFDPVIKPPVDPTPELLAAALEWSPLAKAAANQKHDADAVEEVESDQGSSDETPF